MQETEQSTFIKNIQDGILLVVEGILECISVENKELSETPAIYLDGMLADPSLKLLIRGPVPYQPPHSSKLATHRWTLGWRIAVFGAPTL